MKSYNEKNKTTDYYNNMKLFDRNFMSINKQHNNNDQMSCDSDVGEITGDHIKSKEYGKGMPIRSSYNSKKPIYDANQYLDFNIYNKKPEQKKLGYNESGNYTSFAEVGSSMISMTQQANPDNIVKNHIEFLGTRIFDYISKSFPDNNIAFASIGLYSLFSFLYLAGDDITQNELQKFFNFPKKNILKVSIEKLNNTIDSISKSSNHKHPSFIIKNFIILGDNIPYDPDYIQNNSNHYIFARTNISNPSKEAKKLSMIINKIMNTEMRNPVKSSNIENLQLMFMTVASFKPLWITPFDRKMKGIFYGYDGDMQQQYLISHGKTYQYFEDNEWQILELGCGNLAKNDSGYTLAFGIVLPKNTNKNLSNEKIKFCLEHAKMTTLEEVRIPCFTHNLKFRYNTVLKKLGLNTVFNQIISRQLFMNGRPMLHDVIQNIKITIDDYSSHNKASSRGVISLSRFIANKPFQYYFRLCDDNVIILNGMYIK